MTRWNYPWQVRFSGASRFCVDSLTGTVYFARPSSIVALQPPRHTIHMPWNGLRRLEDVVVSFDFLADDAVLVCVLSSGAVLQIDVTANTIDELASLDGPVLASAWSPDLQLLLLARESTLLMLNRDLQISHEADLNPQSPGQDALVSVGWGSAETQFQGSLGKKKPTNAASRNGDPQSGQLSENESRDDANDDDDRILIAWRADAQLVAVSSVDRAVDAGCGRNQRVIRIWNREAQLLSQCEAIDGMEACLAVRPSGNLIAVCHWANNAHNIQFFERNGQKRHHFLLNQSQNMCCCSLSWSIDANILAVHLQDVNDEFHYVQFWTVRNYDWTLKYSLRTAAVVFSLWDPENAHRFHLLNARGRYRTLDLDLAINVVDCLALVVNGSELRVTDLARAAMPPPLSHFQLQCPAAICEVAFEPPLLALLLANRELLVYDLTDRKFYLRMQYALSLIDDDPDDAIVYGLTWKSLHCLTAIVCGNNFDIVEFDIHADSSTIVGKRVYSSRECIVWQRHTSLGYCVQLAHGKWITVADGDGRDKQTMPLIIHGVSVDFATEFCYNCVLLLEKLQCNGAQSQTGKSCKLVVNGRVLHANVGSFSVDDEFLLVITLDYRLHVIALRDERLVHPQKLASLITASDGRLVERGARLIAHDRLRAWMQMPRGNLETIYPRPLLVNALRGMLARLEYREAIEMMKRHRVDMNLIVDHEPTAFFNNLNVFVDRVNDAELLNLFIASLNKDDTTRGIYAEMYPQRKTAAIVGSDERLFDGHDKVAAVCERLRQSLCGLDANRRRVLFAAILSCYVKQKPPRVTEALTYMKSEAEGYGANSESFIASSLAHLQLLVDERTLFDEALATYDVNIALLVAERSQRDPREYLPMLNALRDAMPIAYRRYRIDMQLQRYQRALAHIAGIEERFDECVALIEVQKLFASALRLFHGTEKYPKICAISGEFYLSKRKFLEAGILFEKSGASDRAIAAYESGRLWRQMIKACESAGVQLGNERLLRIALHMESTNQWMQAAEIYAFIDSKKHKAKLIELFGAAGAWDRALQLLDADTEELLIATAKKRCAMLIALGDEWQELVRKYRLRLTVVRAKKAEQLQRLVETEEMDVAESETQSSTATVSSTGSAQSRLSSTSTHSRRRQHRVERKKRSMREGSRYEDAALLNALKEIVASVDATQDELLTLLPCLLSISQLDDGHHLQDIFSRLITDVEHAIADAWPVVIDARHLPAPLQEIYKDESGEMRMPEQHGSTGFALPKQIRMEEEMIPPRIRRNVFWTLECLK